MKYIKAYKIFESISIVDLSIIMDIMSQLIDENNLDIVIQPETDDEHAFLCITKPIGKYDPEDMSRLRDIIVKSIYSAINYYHEETGVKTKAIVSKVDYNSFFNIHRSSFTSDKLDFVFVDINIDVYVPKNNYIYSYEDEVH